MFICFEVVQNDLCSSCGFRDGKCTRDAGFTLVKELLVVAVRTC